MLLFLLAGQKGQGGEMQGAAQLMQQLLFSYSACTACLALSSLLPPSFLYMGTPWKGV